MIPRADRGLIVVADAGPLTRLAAASLLPSSRGLDRRIPLVDRGEDKAAGYSTKLFVAEVADRAAARGRAVPQVETPVGIGVAALQSRRRADERDRKVASLFLDVAFPVTPMTTRAFARVIADRDIDVDAASALDAIARTHNLKPALVGEIDPATPADQRRPPQAMDP